MVDSTLRSLKERLRGKLEGSVEQLTDDSGPDEYIDRLGTLAALRTVAQRLIAVDHRAEALRAALPAGSDSASINARLDELSGTRRKLVDALGTLIREMR